MALLIGAAMLALVVTRMVGAGSRDMVAHIEHAAPMHLEEAGALEGLHELRLTDGHGTVRATIRHASRGDLAPVVVILGGLKTGRRAVELLDPALPLTVASLDYAWDGPKNLNGFGILIRLPAIQRDLARTAVAMRDLIRHLERQGMAGRRVYVVGTSLGVPIATATAAAVKPAGLALLYGFADHETLLAHRLAPYVPSATVRAVLARALEPLIANLDAARTLPRLCGTEVLVVSSPDDHDLPPRCSEVLWSSTCEPRRRVEVPGGHLRGGRDSQLLLQATGVVTEWLEDMEGGAWVAAVPDSTGQTPASTAARD